jgi:nickel-type superoxide dismutase maturation protease
MQNEIPIAGFREWLNWLLGRRQGVTIDGDSMLPTLRPGDRVFVDLNAAINVGDIVLADHPFKSSIKIVKRLSSIEDDDRIFLSGDNPKASLDSRVLGTFKRSGVVGKVVSRLK